MLVSSTDFANSLTVENASSSHYALAVMTVAALIITPVILLYTAWAYHVFRARVTGEEVVPAPDLVPRESLDGSTGASSAVRAPCGRCWPPTWRSPSSRRCSCSRRPS